MSRKHVWVLPALLALALFTGCEKWVKVSNPAAGSGDPDGLEPLGDRHNSYAWYQAAWPRADGDYLVVGTARDMLPKIFRANSLTADDMQRLFGDYVPVADPDQAPRLFWYKADGSGDWREIYRGTRPGHPQGPDFGYRYLKTYQAPGETGPALYVASAGTIPRILKFPYEFDPAVDQPIEVFRIPGFSLRAMEIHQDRLFVGTWDLRIFAAQDPPVQAPFPPGSPAGNPVGIEGWEQIAGPADFPNAHPNASNPGIWDLFSFNGYLYVFGTGKNATGWVLYKGRPDDTGAWRWQEIIGPQGRYEAGFGSTVNYYLIAPKVFHGHVYVGTYIKVNEGYMPRILAGDIPGLLDILTAAQIWRFDADDNFEMIIGDPYDVMVDGAPVRFEPLGNYGAGFAEGNTLPDRLRDHTDWNGSLNQYTIGFGIHRGRLYTATFDTRVILQTLLENLTPGDFQFGEAYSLFRDALSDTYNPGGLDVYSTVDGITWEPVTRDGFGDRYNYESFGFVNSGDDFFMTTTNPFYGCQVWKKTIVTPDRRK